MAKNFFYSWGQDLKLGLITKPSKADIIFSITVTLFYAAIALPVGLLTGFLKIRVVEISTFTMVILPFSLLAMPSLLEELFFRALMLPHKTKKHTTQKKSFGLFAVFSHLSSGTL
jgi:predicted Abi (CAAX) family protease